MRKDAHIQARRDEIVEWYLAGEGGPAIAVKLGCTLPPIYRALRSAGITPNTVAHDRGTGGKGKRRFTDIEEADIAQLYRDGWSFPKLEQRYGVGHKTLARALKRQAQPSRDRHTKPIRSDQRAAILAMYAARKSIGVIADELHVGPPRVKAVIEAAGEELPVRKRGAEHWRWKGGKTLTMHGYVRSLLPADHPLYATMADEQGYAMEHRLVMAEALGRALEPWETVHHIDGNRQHNAFENLQLRTGQHGAGVVHRCLDCGSTNVAAVPLASYEEV